MIKCIRILFILFPLALEAQNPELLFSGNTSPVELYNFSQREVEKKLGKPDSSWTGWINANIGNCISFRHAFLNYNEKGIQLRCTSYGNKKTSKRKKKLREITWNEKSGIIINEKII